MVVGIDMQEINHIQTHPSGTAGVPVSAVAVCLFSYIVASSPK
jgi:hypothetical protein